MPAKRTSRFSKCLILGLCTAGCQWHKQAAIQKVPPSTAQIVQTPIFSTPPTIVPATQPATPDVLTQRINSYTREVGPLIDHRTQTPTTQPGVQQSPTTFAKGPPPRVIPLANPTTDNQPSTANQSATVEAQQPAMTAALTVSPADLNKTVIPVKPAAIGADLEAKLVKHLQDSPREVWAHLDYQLLQFLRDEQVPQLDVLSSLPLEDRELVSVVMDGLTNFRNGLRADNNMLLSKKIKPLMELADRLRSQADLNIPAMALCTRVDAFGMYDPIEPARFLAGKEHVALLYCEIENFASTSITEKKVSEIKPSQDGLAPRILQSAEKNIWETKLSQEATLYTESGMPVWVDKAGKVVDHSRNRRHDFYIVKRIKLPATLTLGRYLLKVTVEDQEAKRVAEQTMPVEIVAQMETVESTVMEQKQP